MGDFCSLRLLTVKSKTCSVYNFANDWIRTVDLYNQKQPFCQLSHNHFPLFFGSFFKWANPGLFLFIWSFSRYIFKNKYWKKHRCCTWYLNLRPQDCRCRRNHGAMAADFSENCLEWVSYRLNHKTNARLRVLPNGFAVLSQKNDRSHSNIKTSPWGAKKGAKGIRNWCWMRREQICFASSSHSKFIFDSAQVKLFVFFKKMGRTRPLLFISILFTWLI